MVPVLQKGDHPIDNTTSYPPQIYPQQIEDINNSKYLHEHRPKELIPKVFHKRLEPGHDIALNNMGMQSRDKSTHTFHQKEKISDQISEHGPSRNHLRHEKIFARQSRLPDDSDEEEDYVHRSSSTFNDGHSQDGGSDSGPIDFSLFTRNSQDKDDGKKHRNKNQNAPRRQPKLKHLYASSDESDASDNSDAVMSAVQKSSNDKSMELSRQRNTEIESDSTRPSNSQKRRPGRPRKEDVSAIASKLGDNSDTDDSVSSRRRERQTTSDSTASKNKSGATDPNRTDKAGRTRLFSCTGTGNIERVKELIQKGAYVNWRDNAGWTPLHEAALKGQAEVAKYLLSCGAEVNAQGFGNDTPLHDACSNGFSECVQILVDHGANINIQNSDGQRPIDVCEDEDCLDILNKKQKQIDRLATRDKAGRTSLHRACIAGHFDEALSLIKSDSDVNAKDNASWTPLHEASLNGYLDIVKALCEHGADINPMGYDGSTPLHEASENGHVKIVRYLLEMNADKNIQNKKGQTAVQVCDDKSIEDLFSTDVKKSLHAAPMEETTKRSASHASLANQVEPDKKASTAKKTLSREEKKIQALMQTFQKMEKRQAKKTKRRQHRPLDEDDEDEEEEDEEESTSAPPKESEQLQRTKRLVRGRPRSNSLSQSREASEEAAHPKKPVVKLDPKRKDTAGRTHLHKWAVRGDATTVRELLEAGANSNERDHAGWTPLHEAALRGRLEVLKLLLQHGADPNALGADRDTPLHDAVENGHSDIARVLLEHGANVYARNAADLDSLQIARDNSDDDMIAILKSAQKLNHVAPPVRQPKPEPEHDDTSLKVSKSVVSDLAVSVKKMSDHSDTMLEMDPGTNGKTIKKRRLVSAAEYHSRSGSQERKKSEDKVIVKPKAERKLPQALAGGFDIFNISPIPQRKTIKTSPVPKKQSVESEAMDLKKVKKEIEDVTMPKKKFWPSLSHAIQYLPLYTVQLQEIGSSNEERALYVVDLQVRLLLGSNNLFQQYPQLERRLVTEREKERLWSPLAFMVSEKCAQAVKSGHTGKDKDDFNIKVEKGSAIDIARTKEQEKQRFLQTELYFIRLEQTISIIKSDYSHLSNNLITITLDIGYSPNRELSHDKLTYPSTIPIEEDEPTSKSVKSNSTLPTSTDIPQHSSTPLPIKRPAYGLPAKFAMKMQKCGLGHKRDVSK